MSVTTSSDKYVNSRDVDFVPVFAFSRSKNGGCPRNVLAAASSATLVMTYYWVRQWKTVTTENGRGVRLVRVVQRVVRHGSQAGPPGADFNANL
jgi:hypothetical protein